MVDATQGAPESARHEADATRARIAERVGRVVAGAYRLEALLGVGGMAAVYAARRENGSTVALKILHKDHTTNASVASRFLREAHVTRLVMHPSVVRFGEDGVTEDGELFVVMERLLGETLRDEWRRTGSTVPYERVLAVADGLLDALVACHEVGVVHRDLKPANVFVTEDGAIKLLDFGVAHVMGEASDLAAAGTALGTPSYMAPEQAMGQVDRIDPRTDLFGLAALLHALLTGKRVHTATSHREALRLAATQPVPSIALLAPHLPEDLLALVDRALAWDPRSRFASARDMQQAVHGAMHVLGLRGRQTFASEGPRSERPPPPSLPVARASLEPRATTDTPAAAALRALDRALSLGRAYGLAHPAAERALLDLVRFLREAAREQELEIRLEPYGASVAGVLLWEPLPPLDAVLQELHAAGARRLRVRGDVRAHDVRTLVEILLEEPWADPSGERDFVSAAWERGLERVVVDATLPLHETDAAGRVAFVEAVTELERAFAERPELATLFPAERAAGLLVPHAAVLETLRADASLPEGAWARRYAASFAEAVVGEGRADRLARALGSLRARALELVRRGDLAGLVTLGEAVLSELPPAHGRALDVASAFAGGEVLARVAAATFEPAALDAFGRLLEQLPTVELAALLDAAAEPANLGAPALLRAARGFVVRAAPGHETKLALVAVTAPAGVGVALVEALGLVRSPAAEEALGRLAREAAGEVRATAASAVGGSLGAEVVVSMLQSDEPETRIAALGAVAWSGVGSLPGVALEIARRVRQGVGDVAAAEAEAWFRAVVQVDPRGLSALVEVVRQGGGLLSSGPKEAVRAAAVRVLGDVGDDLDAADALDELGRGRRGVSDDTRAAAQLAAAVVRERAGSRGELGQ